MAERKPTPPEDGCTCIECGEKIYKSDEYYWMKLAKMSIGIYSYRGYNFIHKKCYEKLLTHTHTHTMKRGDEKCPSSKGT